MYFAKNSLMISAIVVLFTCLELSSYSLAGTSPANSAIQWTTDPDTCLPLATVVIPNGQSYTAKCGQTALKPSATCHPRKRSKRGAKPGALTVNMVNVLSADYRLQGKTKNKTKCPDINVRDAVFDWAICQIHPTMLVFRARDRVKNTGCQQSLIITYSCAPKTEVECGSDPDDDVHGLEDPFGLPPPPE